MGNKSNIQCIIFDCEGTLVDSERLVCQAIVNAFAIFNVPLQLEDCVQHFEGGKITEQLAKVQHRSGTSLDIDKLEPIYRQQYALLSETHLQPIPGVVDLLTRLKARNIELCVISNSSKAKLKAILSQTQLSHFFGNNLFCGDDVGNWKPAPDILLYSAMYLGFSKDECLYVDDTVQGVQTGIAAGIRTYQYQDIIHSYRAVSDQAPVIRSSIELLSVIDSPFASQPHIA
ncbi:TPA: HAD-IA family hydrolase [Photobacterium damselae]